MRRGVWILLFLTTCGGSSLKGVGETCVASSECETGLVCDFFQTPAVCSSQTSRPDAGPDADLTVIDASDIDAPPGTPDAPMIPDAGTPDAPAAPDADVIDAGLPDADIIDAPVDAA